MHLDILAEDGPQCHITTIADMAPRAMPPNELPEFAFSPYTGHRPAMRGWFEWPDEAHTAPLGPPVPATLCNRLTSEPGKADPIWVTAFTTKFSKRASLDAQPLTPHGTVPPFIPGLLPRSEEIAWLEATQSLELPTTLQELAANEGKGTALDADADLEYEAANIAESHLNQTPYAVFIGMEVEHLPGGRTIETPKYGDSNYINAMKRRIDWERFRSESPRPLRAYFVATQDGDLGIAATSRMPKAYSDDEVLAAKKAVKAHWLRLHDQTMPTLEQIAPEPTQNVRDLLNEDALELERLLMVEDHDPWRNALHGDPDPKPLREQYPYGSCARRCVLDVPTPADEEHNLCTIDGWNLYKSDVSLWEKRHEKEYGYAGPDGLVHFEDKNPDSNPFMRSEERVRHDDE